MYKYKVISLKYYSTAEEIEKLLNDNSDMEIVTTIKTPFEDGLWFIFRKFETSLEDRIGWEYRTVPCNDK